MAAPKTRPTDASVPDFLASIEDERRRADAQAACALIEEETGEKPVMWGTSIVGFGSYQAATGEWMTIGLSPRRSALVLYLMEGFDGFEEALERLGPHRTGRACLYLARLDKVDTDVLRELVRKSYAATNAR